MRHTTYDIRYTDLDGKAFEDEIFNKTVLLKF